MASSGSVTPRLRTASSHAGHDRTSFSQATDDGRIVVRDEARQNPRSGLRWDSSGVAIVFDRDRNPVQGTAPATVSVVPQAEPQSEPHEAPSPDRPAALALRM